MEVLRYLPWQKWAAAWRLVLGLGGLALLLWTLGGVGDGWALFLGLAGVPVVVLYLLHTGVQPLLRAGLEVALEPEGIRVGGRFYPRSSFRGLGAASGWWAQRAWAALEYTGAYGPFCLRPPFYLDFGAARLPLHLDLPGWDRLLRHLGLGWQEVPQLEAFLKAARGIGWLNGLLYPPEEVRPAWAEARARYRRACAWIWAGVVGMLLGMFPESLGLERLEAFLGGNTSPPWADIAFTAIFFAGLLIWLRWFAITFGLRGSRGWASQYSPFGPGA